jgi:hypothetical protein
MERHHGSTRSTGLGVRILYLTPLLALLGLSSGATVAGAVPAQVRDSAASSGGGVVTWSEGSWTQTGNPVPGCATFAGGTATGPGNDAKVDSLVCDPTPDGWHWTVTLPNGSTIHWGIDDLPMDVEVCAQIFYSSSNPELNADVDVGQDVLRVTETHLHTVLYYGSFADFDPIVDGFSMYMATRCGVITAAPTGACCLQTGACAVLTSDLCGQQGGRYQGDATSCVPDPCRERTAGACCIGDEGVCQVLAPGDCEQAGGTYQGDSTVCAPNPCRVVPARSATWGRIKSWYR